MRSILVPAPASIKGFEISYATFVRHLLDTDDRFTKTAAGIRAASRIESCLSGQNGQHLVEEADWGLLKTAAEAPTGGYLTLIETDVNVRRVLHTGRACLPFIDAIAGAQAASP